GSSRYLPEKFEIASLVIERGVRQSQRYQIVKCVDVRYLGYGQRQRVRPVHQVRPRGNADPVHEREDSKQSVGLAIQVGAIVDCIEVGKTALESLGDDGPGNRYPSRL